MLYKYTDSEIKALLKSLIVLVDTREQVNKHIIDYFDKKEILFKEAKLDFGDYSFMLPANQELGIHRDLYFTNEIVIERKGNLEELSGNLTKDRTRIESELLRSKGKVLLLIEGASYEDIVQHNYNTQYNPKSFIATLKAFECRYNMNTSFIHKPFTGNFIYFTFYYFLREYLKNGGLRNVG